MIINNKNISKSNQNNENDEENETQNLNNDYLELKSNYKMLFDMHNDLMDKYDNITHELAEMKETLDKIVNDKKQNIIKMISNLANPEDKKEEKKEELKQPILIETKSVLPKKEIPNKDIVKLRRRNNF